jgi:hypothetical protein
MPGKRTIESSPSPMRDILESIIQNNPTYWKLVKTSSKAHYRPPEESSTEQGSESRQEAVRTYQLYLHDAPTDFGIRFFYDYRNGTAKATFDVVSLRVMEHQVKGDLDVQKIDDYVALVKEGQRAPFPWWRLQ